MVKTTGAIFKYLFMFLAVAAALFPLIWVVMASFKTNTEILQGGLALPSTFSFIGYRQALEISPIITYFFNSVIIAGFTTLFNVLFVAMAAYVFARFTFWGKNALYLILSLSLVIPMTALMHPVYVIINGMGLADTKAGLILVYTALNLPLSLLVLRATFQAIPKGLEEAAYVDGAGFARTFFQIILPCSKSGLVCAAILAFLGSWNEFTFALILTTSQSARTLPLSFAYFTAQFSFNYTALFAAITMAVIPSIAVFAIFQERVISSLTAGAMKE